MTRITFFSDRDGLTGFRIYGHSTACAEDENGRLVCAAISSAAYQTANTVLEILKEPCNVSVNDAEMSLQAETPSPVTRIILEGFKLHVTELSKQYSASISINSEV